MKVGDMRDSGSMISLMGLVIGIWLIISMEEGRFIGGDRRV